MLLCLGEDFAFSWAVKLPASWAKKKKHVSSHNLTRRLKKGKEQNKKHQQTDLFGLKFHTQTEGLGKCSI